MAVSRNAPILDSQIIISYLLSYSCWLDYPIKLNYSITKYDHKGTKGRKVITKLPQRLDQYHPIPIQTHLIKRGSQTACNHKHDCHDSCTLCRS
jgi:hypothetical protein